MPCPSIWKGVDGWRLAAMGAAAAVALPVGMILISFLEPASDTWRHIASHLLGDLVVNTLILGSGVLIVTAVLGVGLAWLTAVFDFPGRAVLSWLLVVPMAIPTYVLAFVFLGIFDFMGPVQSAFRDLFPGRFSPVDVRSAPGVVLVLSLCLYPYVYLLAKGAFLTQGRRAMEAARSLGCGPAGAFFRVALPMARPWIAGGLMLVLMETLADFGAVAIFNYDTFTTAIYKAWFGFFSIEAASQLASLLVVAALAIMIVEQQMRSRMRFYQSDRTRAGEHRIRLSGWRAVAAFMCCGIVVLAAVVLPMARLMTWSIEGIRYLYTGFYIGALLNSLVLGLAGAGSVVAAALVLSYAARHHPDPLTRSAVRVATLGYALPGAVLAVGLFVGLSAVDRLLETGFGIGPFLQGGVAALLLAYSVRYMAVGFHPVSSAMLRITPSIDEAARSLGARGARMLRRVHVPMLRSGLLTAMLLAFVDIMKEMPITLMLRPFGWDTLAVKIYELTSEGEWERAALPAVVLVICGLAPVVLMMRRMQGRSR